MTDEKLKHETRSTKHELRNLNDRILEFGSRILKMERVLLRDSRVNKNCLRQLSRSATAVGANLEEARGAQSPSDYYAKLKIALKEAREAHYWLQLLHKAESVPASRINPLIDEANQLVAILTSIAKKRDPRKAAALS